MRRTQGLARESLDAPRIHRTQRVHLQERAALVLDEHYFGQHKSQARERLEQLVSGRRVLGIEAVEREEYRLMGGWPFQIALHPLERGQRNAASHAHEANGSIFAVIDELIGEAFLQHTVCINDIGFDRLRV